jgi:hypothetical protein
VKNENYDIIQPLEGRKVIRSKWAFPIKRKTNGEVNKYHARLVTHGFSHTKGLDFHQILAPIVKFISIKVLLTLATTLDLEIHQMDVKCTFLNRKLEKDI